MMNWNSITSVINQQDNRMLLGDLRAAFVTLTFDTTAAGPAGATVAGQTYDPVNYFTTAPAWSDVAGKNLLDAAGFRNILQIVCFDMSSSATAQLAAATSFTGTVKIVWDEVKQAFKLFLVGNSSTSAGADPTVRTDETELTATAATAMNGLAFRMLVIGR